MKGPNEKPLGLDMDFGEALRRFVRTSSTELAESIEAEKENRERAKKARREAEKDDPINPTR